MKRLVSIIIPTYNRSSFLGETLDSIIDQTYQNWECIIVDDGSSDYTVELMEFYMKKDQRFSFSKRPKNRPRGGNACRNYGFEISKGDFITWFDSDDIIHPARLENQLKTLFESNYQFSVCKAFAFEGNTNQINGLRFNDICSKDPFYDYLRMKIGWLTTPVWRRNYLIGLGHLYDEELKAAQEWEFHLRVLSKKPFFVSIDDPLIYVRKHDFSLTYHKNEEGRSWNYYQARLKIYFNPDIFLDTKSKIFLKQYLLNAFKKMVFHGDPKAIMALKKFVLKEESFSVGAKSNALIALMAYKLFGKGNVFLQKIKYNV